MQCDLCEEPICGWHSRAFAYTPDGTEVATRICYECDVADRSWLGIALRR